MQGEIEIEKVIEGREIWEKIKMPVYKLFLCVVVILILLLNTSFTFGNEEGYVIEKNKVYWEKDSLGRIEVWPHTVHGFGGTQYINITSYLPSGTELDFAFIFDEKLVNANVWIWENISHSVCKTCDYTFKKCSLNDLNETICENITKKIKSCNLCGTYEKFYYDWKSVRDKFDYKEWKGKHIYFVKNVNFKEGETKFAKIQYNVKPRLGKFQGKWSLLIKKSNDNLEDAITNKRYIKLDPWWNISYNRRIKFNITETNGKDMLPYTPVSVHFDIPNGIVSNCSNVALINESNAIIPVDVENETYSGGYCDSFNIVFQVDNITANSKRSYELYYDGDSYITIDPPSTFYVTDRTKIRTGNLGLEFNDEMKAMADLTYKGFYSYSSGHNYGHAGWDNANYEITFYCDGLCGTTGSVGCSLVYNGTVKKVLYCDFPGGTYENVTVWRQGDFVDIFFKKDPTDDGGSVWTSLSGYNDGIDRFYYYSDGPQVDVIDADNTHTNYQTDGTASYHAVAKYTYDEIAWITWEQEKVTEYRYYYLDMGTSGKEYQSVVGYVRGGADNYIQQDIIFRVGITQESSDTDSDLYNHAILASNSLNYPLSYEIGSEENASFGIALCNEVEFDFLNITFYDESSYSRIYNLTFKGHFDISSENQTINKTFNLINISQFCLGSTKETLVSINATIEYEKDGYAKRNYYYINEQFNTSQMTNLYLHLLPSSDAQGITLNLKDNDGNNLEGYYFKIQKYDVGLNAYKEAGMGKTDYAGNSYVYLNPYNTFYKFIIIDSNGNVKQIHDAFKISTTNLYFTLTAESQAEFYSRFENIYYSLESTSDNFTLEWTTSEEKFKRMCLKVREITSYWDRVICEECSSLTSGELVCDLNNDNATFIATAIARIEGSNVDNVLEQKEITKKATSLADKIQKATGGFMSVFITGSLIALGLFSPAVAIVLGVIGVIISSLLGLIKISLSILMGLVIAAGFFIIKMRR